MPAIAQDEASGDVLMLAWMNAESLALSLAERRAVYWSRSRQALWRKGETSGNTLELVDVHADCDRDTLLVLAVPHGPTCHLGTDTCWGDEVNPSVGFLAELERVVESRVVFIRQFFPRSLTHGDVCGHRRGFPEL